MNGAPRDPADDSAPDLSICIVSYRCRDSLLACLTALRSGPPSLRIETLVVDNHSADGSVEAVRTGFSDVDVTELADNRGFAYAANHGLARARGRYVLLLNPDVRVSGTTLARAVEFLDGDPTWGVLGIRLRYPDGRIQGSCGHFPDTVAVLARSLGAHNLLMRFAPCAARENLPYFCFPSDIHEVDGVLGAFLMVRRKELARVGLLDEGYFLYGEDVDWCRRARRLGVRIVHNSHLEAVHEQGTSAAQVPWRSLRHFHRSAVRYHRLHERPTLPWWARPIARASLSVRYALAVARHLLGWRPAHRVYLELRRDSVSPPNRAVSGGSD